MSQGKAPGPSHIKVDDLKDWVHAYKEGLQQENSGWESPESVHERVMHWILVVVLVQEIFKTGQVPESFKQVVLVLIPKQDTTKYCGIALLETIYKLCSSIINCRMCHNVGWHNGVHGFHEGRGCMTAIIEAQRRRSTKEKSCIRFS